ncbi:MAG: diaminopimelate epimerase [Frankiaceae bacterium]
MRFAKGHGTGNDFVLLPDPNARLQLSARLVGRLCDRRKGIGADGVLRVARTAALQTQEPALAEISGGAEYFMDYRNADGSVAEMCGNGIRVFARYLVRCGWSTPGRVEIGTRSGVRVADTPETGDVVVDMGPPVVDSGNPVKVTVSGRTYAGVSVSMGNPHVVCEVRDLAEVGDLLEVPEVDNDRFTAGANVEFVQRTGRNSIAMRVYERGVGETQSCGTGACAAAVAMSPDAGGPPCVVSVPGGRLFVRWTPETVHLGGPAVIVAEGTLTPEWASR